MAPKKDIHTLGSTQPVGDGWRAEVSNAGKGPTRTTLAEATRDLEAAQQANTQEEMKTVLAQLRQDARSAQSVTCRQCGSILDDDETNMDDAAPPKKPRTDGSGAS